MPHWRHIHKFEPRPALVIVCGIEEHKFTQPQLDAIRAYVESNGVILFETPGGRGNFTLSAENAVTALFKRPIESLLRNRIISGEGLTVQRICRALSIAHLHCKRSARAKPRLVCAGWRSRTAGRRNCCLVAKTFHMRCWISRAGVSRGIRRSRRGT